jgi:hypothetical protein
MQRIGFTVVPNFWVPTLAALTVVEVANMKPGEPQYELRTYLNDSISAYNYARRLKTLKGLTPYEFKRLLRKTQIRRTQILRNEENL